jgi:hypothetical protein
MTPDRRVFRYEDLSIGVHSYEDSHLDWLEEFLSPQFGVENGTAADWELTLALDGDRYDEIIRLGPKQDEMLCFALDTRDIRLPRWNSSSSADVLFDERFDTFYLVEARARRITLLSRVDGGDARLALMRVVRELAMNHTQRNGGVIVHAAAFTVGSRGVIVAGPKGAGKTTLLMYALQSTPSEYVSNDRLLLSLDDRGPRIRGIPTIVTIRQSTLRFFPTVLERLQERGYTVRLTRREARKRRPSDRAVGHDGPRSLSPGQLCALLEAPSTAGAPVTAVAFPQLSDRAGPLRLTRIPKKRAAKRLFDSLFGVRKLRTTSPLFSDAPDQPPFDRDRLEGACAALTSTVPCYECELGPDAYTDPRSPKVLLDQFSGDGNE